MSIIGEIKHGVHHAEHQVEHGVSHAAHKVKDGVEQGTDEAAKGVAEGTAAVVQAVEDDIKAGMKAAIQKAVHRAWSIMKAALEIATPTTIQVQISALSFEVDDPLEHVKTMEHYAKHPAFDRDTLIDLVTAIGPDTVSLSVGAEAVELVVTSIDEEIEVTLTYELDEFIHNAERLIKEF